jgi:hypothetical protein
MTATPLSALIAFIALAGAPAAQTTGQSQDPGAVQAAQSPQGLTGVEALVGIPMSSLAAAPLVCADPAPDGAKACRVARRYGDYLIDSPPPLTDKVRLKRLTLFVRGQSVEAVSLETSPDNFHALLGLLKARFGPPASSHSARIQFAHGAAPRLTMTWRAGGLRASLTDPTPFGALSVRITASHGLPKRPAA